MFASSVTKSETIASPDDVPVLALGRYNYVRGYSADEAFAAMFDAAKTSIKLFLQDLGPMRIRGNPYGWPKQYFECCVNGMKERDVDIEIVLSNPDSGAHRGKTYSNGFSTQEVAAEIMKTMKRMYPALSDEELEDIGSKHLKVTFLKTKRGDSYERGHKVGLHSKVFFIDEKCTYVGSQNLYVCDLAEWGVLVDDKEHTIKFMDELWNPAWSCSYQEAVDSDFGAIMAIIDEDRKPDHDGELDHHQLALQMIHLTDRDIEANSCFKRIANENGEIM